MDIVVAIIIVKEGISMSMSTDRKKEIIKHLAKDYFMFNLYDDISSKDKVICEIDEILKKHGIGKIADPFVLPKENMYAYLNILLRKNILKGDTKDLFCHIKLMILIKITMRKMQICIFLMILFC